MDKTCIMRFEVLTLVIMKILQFSGMLTVVLWHVDCVAQ